MEHILTESAVLVVEDDANQRDAIEHLLQSRGYVVATARDGNEALSVLRSGFNPCMILLDLTLPNKDGFQFRAEQRQDPKLAAIPVVVYSGHHDPTQYASVLRAAVYLQKPIHIDLLLKIVDSFAAPARHAA